MLAQKLLDRPEPILDFQNTLFEIFNQKMTAAVNSLSEVISNFRSSRDIQTTEYRR